MIVVAAIGVLAALAVQAGSRYMAAAYSAEAKTTVGSIGKATYAATLRRYADDPSVPFNGLCLSAAWVPRQFNRVRRRKYQPSTAPGDDYQIGDGDTGWPCLKFEISQPQAYQYRYKRGRAPVASGIPLQSRFGGSRFTAVARGDRDRDGVWSWFALEGIAIDGDVRIMTAISEVRPGE